MDPNLVQQQNSNIHPRTVLYIVLSIILTAGIVGGAMYWWKSSENTKLTRINKAQSVQIDSYKIQLTAKNSTSESTQETIEPKNPKMQKYHNNEYGFEFEYPETNFLIENVWSISPSIKDLSHQFDDPGLIVQLTNDSQTQNVIDIAVLAIKKEAVESLFTRLKSGQEKSQKTGDAWCKKFISEEGFEQCAYYGGGWTYSTTTIDGVQAVEAFFAGEGGRTKKIFLPSKGISIYMENPGDKRILSDDDFLKSFKFTDSTRTIVDSSTQISFNCPAYWSCDYIDTDTIPRYNLYGPQNQYIELNLKNAIEKDIEKLIEDKKIDNEEDEVKYAKALSECKSKNGTPEECDSYVSYTAGMIFTDKESTMSIKGEQGVFSGERIFYKGDYFGFNLFFPKKGWIISASLQSGDDIRMSKEFIESLFK